ncbi:hypothetical protein LV85_02582 [Algoriphagus chordae]|uniref:Uncharacterized protein n=1 Tax=Algoriphagus chordae TaxID=237019 RepID=A0A2W7R9W3_9BACT|nr:hypothetical protein LV85_02582 [Algoriphagus chordae]
MKGGDLPLKMIIMSFHSSNIVFSRKYKVVLCSRIKNKGEAITAFAHILT